MQNLSKKLLALEESRADEDLILNCRENLLNAKREMLLWNKINKKTQIDIAVKQISTLQLQMDSNQSDMHALTLKRLHDDVYDRNTVDEVCINSVFHYTMFSLANCANNYHNLELYIPLNILHSTLYINYIFREVAIIRFSQS